jgi:DNA-binding NtrC family response regulator
LYISGSTAQARRDATGARRQRTLPLAKEEAMSYHYKILVIDDEPVVGERLNAFLTKDGYRVESFVDPLAAIDRLQDTDFDIVVTDIRMGGMDGIEVMEKVFEKSRRTKVIMISGYATLELARESLTKGAFDFIAKPFKLKEIRKTIKRAAESLEREDAPPESVGSA